MTQALKQAWWAPVAGLLVLALLAMAVAVGIALSLAGSVTR